MVIGAYVLGESCREESLNEDDEAKDLRGKIVRSEESNFWDLSHTSWGVVKCFPPALKPIPRPKVKMARGTIE